MNFKPTLWKSVISVIGGLLIDIYLSRPKVTCTIITGVEDCLPESWYSHIFDPIAIVIWMVSALIIYIFWSLFEKR